MGSEAGLTGVAKQAEQLRLDGNFYFSKDRYGAAIDAYTEVNFFKFRLKFYFFFPLLLINITKRPFLLIDS